MNARLWIVIAGLVPGLGCLGSHSKSGIPWLGSEGCKEDPKIKVCADDATCDAPIYTDNGDGTVKSSCCGLVWQQVLDDKGGVKSITGDDGFGYYDWDGAMAYCAGLTLAGASWRLPTVEELLSLVVLGQTPLRPTIDRTAFPNTPPSAAFWSSSALVCSDSGWIVAFYDGQADDGAGPLNSGLRVRCVR